LGEKERFYERKGGVFPSEGYALKKEDGKSVRRAQNKKGKSVFREGEAAAAGDKATKETERRKEKRL